ncbi:cyclin-dependent protein kinase inhibitor SMR13 [Cajanus cajan]|uniref:Uncharacterized protein n=1 Tax=Cajanus cajan TaxID=3821 RepID=A0A151U2L6_CAJCA|nr:cyclin-dependent protein kinase inhibitor SMR13 [Cajanus cajan]KYP73516.1 hypothetical protein KK1_006143 [Cajanus cajan]
MVASGRTRSSRKKKKTRGRRQLKKQHQETPSSKKMNVDCADVAVCSTPKGQKFRIPEPSTCPPPPKKPRLLLSNYSLRRSPLAFFAPPDLDIFFCLPLPDQPLSFVC